MLAQSLFAPAVTAAPLAGDASAAPADAGAFGRLVDQATREAAPVEGSSLKPAVKGDVGVDGPQTLPGSEPAPAVAKPTAPTRPEVLPGEDALEPEIQVLPADQPVKPAVKTEVSTDPRPQVLPAETELDSAPRPEVLPGRIDVPPPPLPTPQVEAAAPATAAAASGSADTPPPAAASVPPVDAPSLPAQGQPAAPAPAPASGTASSEREEAPQADAPPPETKPELVAAPQTPSSAVPPKVETSRAPTASLEAPRPDVAAAPLPEPGLPPGAEAPATPSETPVFNLSRVAHETLADLTAQVVKRLEGKYTRFEMALTPEDLGRVDVRLEMGEDGSLTARLAFDTPAAAAEMRAQADQLRRQLEQAGFQLARDALDFSHRDGSAQQRQDGFERRSGRAFAAARDLADRAEAAPLAALSLSLGSARDRVDVKV